jgi:hypothetical protein
MAVGKYSDFVQFQTQVYSFVYEELTQKIDIYNENSFGAISMLTETMVGDYKRQTFFDAIGDAAYRDITAQAALTPSAITQDEEISVKVARRLGPYQQTLDAWKKEGFTTDQAMTEMARGLAKQYAEKKVKDMVNTGVTCIEAALSGQSANTYSNHLSPMETTFLVEGMALMGDAYGKIKCWLMHSHVYFDLVKNAIADKIYQEAGFVVYGGTPGTLNIPVIVADVPALNVGAASQTTTYQTLGIVENGLVITNSEDFSFIAQPVTGYTNLSFEVQAEYAYNVGVKGFKWDMTNGGANPTDAKLRTATNWDKVKSDAKLLAGVRIVTA